MITDAHVHVFGNQTEAIGRLIGLEEELGYDRFLFLSLEAMDVQAQNAVGICLKLLRPDCYIFGGLNYGMDLDFAEEVRTLRAIGFDGMKMIEQKPTVRRELDRSALDPIYDGFFRFLETEQMPVLMHVGDPPEFWDPELVPHFARENGWFYVDGTYVPLEQLYAEHEQLLERYSRMKTILAHFYFLSHRPDELDRLFRKFPNLSVDLTSGSEMYFNFSQNPEFWREFFAKWQDRLIYGTDNTDSEEETDLYNTREINRMQLGFLKNRGTVPVWDKSVEGLGLDLAIQEKIFSTNIQKLCGDPKPLDRGLALAYLRQYRQRNTRLTEADLTLLQTIEAML